MGYLHLAFDAGNTSGRSMNVSCNLNELLPVHVFQCDQVNISTKS